MERNENEKSPVILDFGGDEWEAVKKLEAILCTTPWNHYLNIYDDTPNETKLLLELLREKAIVVGEVYYTRAEITEEHIRKASEYLLYLHKREIDHNLLSIVNFFSNHEIDIPLTDRFALYYPHIKAYVRCGDLEPVKLFDLLRNDYCEKVIMFNGATTDDGSEYEAFYSFELRMPKTYITEKLAKLQDEKTEMIFRTLEKIGNDRIIPDIKFPPSE